MMIYFTSLAFIMLLLVSMQKEESIAAATILSTDTSSPLITLNGKANDAVTYRLLTCT